jgi:hypothetical protein
MYDPDMSSSHIPAYKKIHNVKEILSSYVPEERKIAAYQIIVPHPIGQSTEY